MKKVYIAGPYSAFLSREVTVNYDTKGPAWNNDKVEYNIYMAKKYAVILANEGIGFFCPHTHTANFHWMASAPEDFYKELDLSFVDDCQAILLIDDWEKSSGAQNEYSTMHIQGKPAFKVSDANWLEQVKEWYFA